MLLPFLCVPPRPRRCRSDSIRTGIYCVSASGVCGCFARQSRTTQGQRQSQGRSEPQRHRGTENGNGRGLGPFRVIRVFRGSKAPPLRSSAASAVQSRFRLTSQPSILSAAQPYRAAVEGRSPVLGRCLPHTKTAQKRCVRSQAAFPFRTLEAPPKSPTLLSKGGDHRHTVEYSNSVVFLLE